MQQLLIGSALSLIVGACSLPADREPRAYNVCLARHAQETALCEGLRQAYEVDASDIPARATASRPAAGYIREVGSAKYSTSAPACAAPSRPSACYL